MNRSQYDLLNLHNYDKSSIQYYKTYNSVPFTVVENFKFKKIDNNSEIKENYTNITSFSNRSPYDKYMMNKFLTYY
jgi:hypothetical protein